MVHAKNRCFHERDDHVPFNIWWINDEIPNVNSMKPYVQRHKVSCKK